jgi:hypothetical protein
MIEVFPENVKMGHGMKNLCLTPPRFNFTRPLLRNRLSNRLEALPVLWEC